MVNFLRDIVKEAYVQIKDIKKEISLKGEKDYVTNCDLIIEKYMIDKIKEKFPDITILSEEFNYDKEKCEKYFTIDPIDGTINFASGLDIWGTQVAYIENGKAMVSVLYFPKLDILIQSEKGRGTYVNGNKSYIKEYKDLLNSLVVFDFSKPSEESYILIGKTINKMMRVREFGAASFGFGMMAIGKIDGYYVAQNTPWDIEPGLLACIESGAKYYRDDFCTIVANSDDIINCILDSLNTNNKKKFKNT